MRSWKFWLGVIVSAIFIWITVRGLDWSQFWVELQHAQYWWIVPGVAVYTGAVWVRTWRWHYMLRHLKAIPTARLFPIVVIGYMGNNVYPARAGEVLRSYVLWRKEGVAISASLATVVLERIFDGLVMLLFVFVTLPFAPFPDDYRNYIIGFSALFLIALVAFLALAARPQEMSRLYAWGVNTFVPLKLRDRVHGLFDRFVLGLQSLRSPREMFWIFFSSTLIWLTETTKYWFVMHAFPAMNQAPAHVTFPVLMLMTAIVNLVTTVPSAPGYVGTFDAPGIEILMRFGVQKSVATAYTLVLHIALWLPITALGAYYMLRESVSWRDMDRAAAAKEHGAAAEEVAEELMENPTPSS